jgi:peroxiredoxin
MITIPSLALGPRSAWRAICIAPLAVALMASLVGCASPPAAPAPPLASVTAAPEATTTSEPGPAVEGATAPDFTLAGLDGKAIKLSDLRGTRVLLVFLATWCTDCRPELPELQKLYETRVGRNLTVVAVDTMEPAIAVQRFMRRNNCTFPVALDEEGALAKAYEAYVIPASAFVDSSGILVRREMGALTVKTVEEMLEGIR